MKSVNRTTKPDILQQHAADWTKELLDQIALTGKYSKVDEKYKTRYRDKQIQAALKKMYDNRCCYCEGLLELDGYGRVEHFRPKSIFPHLCYDWNNLHWCCEICNNLKSDQWDDNNPVLDPTQDQIDDFLKLDLMTGMYESIDNNPRAEATIKFTALNRPQLTKARIDIIHEWIQWYKKFRNKDEFIRLLHQHLVGFSCQYPDAVRVVLDSLEKK